MKRRPNLELLRAKLALMNPDACPAVALTAANGNFPDALQTPWLIGATVAPATVPQGNSSSKSPISSSSALGPPVARLTSSAPQSATRRRSGRGVIGVGTTAATAPPPRDARIVTTNANLRVAASASAVASTTATAGVITTNVAAVLRSNALSFAANNLVGGGSGFGGEGTGADAAFVRGPNVAPPVMPPGSTVFTRSLLREGQAANLCAESDDEYVYGGHGGNDDGCEERVPQARCGEVGEISDDSEDEDVEMAGADDGEEEGFEPRYVVVDAVGWVFREVATATQAARRCEQKNMPPICAGNGVWLYINDKAHAMLLDGFRRVSRLPLAQRKMTGSSRNSAVIRTERSRLRRWERERGYVVDAADRKWDFSPLWYMFRAEVEAIKSAEKSQVRRHARADGGGFGGAVGGAGRGGAGGARGGRAGGAGREGSGRVGDAGPADVAGEETVQEGERRMSDADRSWLGFEDEG